MTQEVILGYILKRDNILLIGEVKRIKVTKNGEEIELRDLVLEKDSDRITQIIQYEDGDIGIIDELVKLLSENYPELQANVLEILLDLHMGFSDWELWTTVYERIKVHEKEILNKITELLHSKNSKIREIVAFSLGTYEDGEGYLLFAEKMFPRLIELLNDEDFEVQKSAGYTMNGVANSMEKRKSYENYLEILSILTKNVKVLSHLNKFRLFKPQKIQALRNLMDKDDQKISQKAAELLEIFANL